VSTDTDYVITIKGKDAALRKAAADFIELALNPWNPQRNDKKTLTRVDVFRNESNCAGFFTPSSLCEEAAKLFPGVNVSFSSKDEYGYTEDGEWAESGEPPESAQDTVATKVFERIQTEIEQPHRRVAWLTPLAEWASHNKVPNKTGDAIGRAFEEAQAAERNVKAELEAEADKENQKETEAAKAFESMTRWRFHPLLAVENELIGKLEKPVLWRSRTGWLDDEESVWGEVWEPCSSADLDADLEKAIEDECESVAIGLTVKAESKTASKFLESQTYGALGYIDSARIFIRTEKGVEAASAKIIKHDASLVWLHSVNFVEHSGFKAEARKAMRLAVRLDDASVWKVSDEKVLRGDKQGLADEIGDHIAINPSHVFFATNNSLPQDAPSGRIFCASLEDGQVQWTSSERFSSCSQLVLCDNSTLLAICSASGSPPLLLCVNAVSGSERWRALLGEAGSAFQIAASSETVAVLSYNDSKARVSWWNTATGEKTNETTAQEAGWNRPELAMDSLRTYVAARSYVKAFGADGEELWSVQLPECDRIGVSLTDNNRLIVSRGDQGAICLHCETGAMAWAVPPNKLWTLSNLVGNKDTVFFAAAGLCAAHDVRDGSLLREIKIAEEQLAATPVAITDQCVLLQTGYNLFEWFGVSDGERLGAYWFSAGRSLRSNGVLTKDGMLICAGSPTLGGATQLICVDLGIGSPSGAWPMDRQGPGGAAFLRIQEKPGYKQFIKAWKDGEDLSHRLAKFAATPDSDKAREARIHGIIRGHELIGQARSWVGPSIGSGKTATARGAQWRLVMAYGGFELLAKSLAGAKDRGLDEKAADSLIGKLALPMLEPLAPPPIDKSSLKDWMDEEDASDVLDFLKMDKGDRNRFDAWLAKQQPITEWTDALLLAKAFRNATAHGALSPTKVEEWKLGEALARLTEGIFQIDEAVFQGLGRG
jgi:hypothetical protein